MSSNLDFCRAENLRLGHGRQPLNSAPLNFAFPAGKLTALVGRNGAGKSTLLQAILGDPVWLGGEIFLGAGAEVQALSKLSAQAKSEWLGFVPQENQFPGHLRLVDFLKLAYLPKIGYLGKSPDSSSPEIQAVLKQFSLEPLALCALDNLSTGERQKAFLARAVLQNPKLLLLDEPTNHLDPGAVHSLWNSLLTARRQQPFEILVSTHDLAFVKHHAEWVCALTHGQVSFNGPVADFWAEAHPRRLFGEILPV